jgi:Fic family protein
MPINNKVKKRIQALKIEYDNLKKGKESLLNMIDEAELPENVYNSNAIENSTLTLNETEKILLEMDLSREVSLREVFEAKNLARVVEYKRKKAEKEDMDKNLIIFLHEMLIGGINDKIAGRFRKKGEYVRVGTYIAPPPEKIEKMIEEAISDYLNNLDVYFLDRIAKFHLDFEKIHPFCDGNGRIGRALINFQLLQFGFPRIIIRNKEKKNYYQAFKEYIVKNNSKPMEKIIILAVLESFNKRIAYLKGKDIILLSEYIKKKKLSSPSVTNAARRQTIPAFREKGVWKIADN